MYLSRTRNNSGGNGQGVPNTLSFVAKLARAGGGGGGGVGVMRVIRAKFVFGLVDMILRKENGVLLMQKTEARASVFD